MPLRAWLCLGLLAFSLVFVGLADIDSWPFSCFPMYSAPIRVRTFRHYAIYIVTREGKAVEVRTGQMLWPLNYQRLPPKVRLLRTLPDGRERIQTMLRYYSVRALAQYKSQGVVAGFPEKVQLRSSFGHYVIRHNVLYPRISRYQVLAQVVNHD